MNLKDLYIEFFIYNIEINLDYIYFIVIFVLEIKVYNMITFAELKENGFVEDGEWNNRFYFTKNGFDIVEHYGVSRWDDQNLSGYGKTFETIEELNEAYRKWAEKRIKKYEEYGEQIRILKESLK